MRARRKCVRGNAAGRIHNIGAVAVAKVAWAAAAGGPGTGTVGRYTVVMRAYRLSAHCQRSHTKVVTCFMREDQPLIVGRCRDGRPRHVLHHAIGCLTERRRLT